MASSYSADLKLELMATGEKSGLWGDITNTNLIILQQAIAGYEDSIYCWRCSNYCISFF
jgi:hypothetical protein